MAGDIVRRGVGFLMIPLYTRYLTPADYGIIELVELFVMISTVCFGLSVVGDSAVRIYHEQRDEEGRGTVVSSAILIVAMLGACLAATAALASGRLSLWIFSTPKYAALIRAAFVALLFSSITDLALVYQQIRQRACFFVVFSVCQLAVTVALNIYMIGYVRLGVWGFVTSKLMVSGVSAGVLLWRVFHEITCRFEWQVVRRMIGFGGPLILSSASVFIIHFSDRFFLNHFATLADVGVYALAYKMGFLVTYLVGQPFGNVWNVSLFAYATEAGWKQNFARVSVCLTCFLVMAATGVAVFAHGMLAITTNESYGSAAFLAPIIAFGYAFREIGDFFRGMLFINKRVLLFGRITMGCAFLNLALDLVLIRKYGATGAAWATLLTWGAYMVLCWLRAWREHRVPVSPVRVAGLCSLGAVVYYASTSFWRLTLAGELAANALLMLLFLTYSWAAGYLDFTTDLKTPVGLDDKAAQAVPE
jgi:O-antigen/teichoic acid export membrane protein